MKAKITEPLEHTQYPDRDVIQSFSELTRNFLAKKLDSRTLPHNRMVRLCYNDGTISSNEICLAIMHSCRDFGTVAIIESEINYLHNSYDNVVTITYNKVMSKDFSLDLANPINSIIVKDYEVNCSLHGEDIGNEIKIYFRDLNFHKMNDGNSYAARRGLYPCFFLVN